MERQLPEDYFTRDFPYHKLEGLKEEEISDINIEIENIRDITKNIDITDCCLVEEMNFKTNLYIEGEIRFNKNKYLVCSAFYIPENETINFSMNEYIERKDLYNEYIENNYRKIQLKFPEDIILKNNIYTSPNEGISNILDISRSLEYIRDIPYNFEFADILEKNNYISDNIDITKWEFCKNEFEFYKFEEPFAEDQICFKDIHHNFGDREIILDGEKYTRCDIVKPYHSRFTISGEFKKVYTEWIYINTTTSCIRWIGDRIIYVSNPILNYNKRIKRKNKHK